MQFFIILALTATFAGAFAVPANESRGIGVSDSFESSCKRWKLTQVGGDAWLDAYCKGKGGAQWHSVINLN
jgi:hypothetical protein